MEGGIAIALTVILLVVAGAVGLVLYLSGISIGVNERGLDAEPPEPVKQRISARDAERQLSPETRRAHRHDRPHAA